MATYSQPTHSPIDRVFNSALINVGVGDGVVGVGATVVVIGGGVCTAVVVGVRASVIGVGVGVGAAVGVGVDASFVKNGGGAVTAVAVSATDVGVGVIAAAFRCRSGPTHGMMQQNSAVPRCLRQP